MSQRNHRPGVIVGNYLKSYADTTTGVGPSFVTLTSSPITDSVDVVTVFNSCAEPIWLAWASTTTASSATTTSNALLVFPGGTDGERALFIPSGSSLFIRAHTSTVTSGNFIINLFRDNNL